MSAIDEPENLQGLIESLRQAGDADQPVKIESMLQATGERSVGALLLVPGLLVLSPLSGIPGLPSVFAVMVMLIAGQLLVGRRHFWLPQWLLQRTASRSKYDRALAFLKRPAAFVDRLIRPRLKFLTQGLAIRGNALLCMAIAATMPPLEIIPFGNTTAGAALSVLGVGMMARDGLMILLAIVFLLALLFLISRIWL